MVLNIGNHTRNKKMVKKILKLVSILSMLSFVVFIYFLLINPGFSFINLIIFMLLFHSDLAEYNGRDKRTCISITCFDSLFLLLILVFAYHLSWITSFIMSLLVCLTYPIRRWNVLERRAK